MARTNDTYEAINPPNIEMATAVAAATTTLCRRDEFLQLVNPARRARRHGLVREMPPDIRGEASAVS